MRARSVLSVFLLTAAAADGRLLAQPVCGDGVCKSGPENCVKCPEDCCPSTSSPTASPLQPCFQDGSNCAASAECCSGHCHGDGLCAAASISILRATYETGTLDSGIEGLTGTTATAADAAYVSQDYARNGSFSIGHKVVLGDSSYTSSGAPRSESDTLAILDTRYSNGTDALYQFSFLLHDWEDWLDNGIPNDVIWQFKHTQGGPDGFFGIKRNSLVMRYNGAEGFQANIVADVRPFDNMWIDIKVEVRWRDSDTGSLRVWAKTPVDADFQIKVDKTNFRTFTDNASGDFGYLKYGLYRPDSTTANNAITRVIYHDEIAVSHLA